MSYVLYSLGTASLQAIPWPPPKDLATAYVIICCHYLPPGAGPTYKRTARHPSSLSLSLCAHVFPAHLSLPLSLLLCAPSSSLSSCLWSHRSACLHVHSSASTLSLGPRSLSFPQIKSLIADLLHGMISQGGTPWHGPTIHP